MLLQCFKMAWKAISGNKMRSFLTMLGIIIGVVALVVLVSLVSGTTSSITDQINSLGTNLLSVSIDDDGGNPLRLSELGELLDNEEIANYAPMAQTSATAKYNYNSGTATVYGTTAGYMDIAGLTLDSGRFIKTTDVDNNTYVAVLSYDAAEELFETTNVVGYSIQLDGISFQIVGVLAEDESLTSSFMSSMTVYIPYTSALRLSSSLSNSITSLYVSATNTESLDDAETVLDSILLERFNENEDAYTITNQDALAETMSTVTNLLAALLGGIAAISLLVGGIGIMNIMLVSVTERTKEIGVRKAIGAGRLDIMLQFLIEALMVCMIGCAIGVGLSWAILEVISILVESVTFYLSTEVVIIAVAFSVFIGLVFGLYPANQAAKKRPIDALHYGG